MRTWIWSRSGSDFWVWILKKVVLSLFTYATVCDHSNYEFWSTVSCFVFWLNCCKRQAPTCKYNLSNVRSWSASDPSCCLLVENFPWKQRNSTLQPWSSNTCCHWDDVLAFSYMERQTNNSGIVSKVYMERQAKSGKKLCLGIQDKETKTHIILLQITKASSRSHSKEPNSPHGFRKVFTTTQPKISPSF